MAEWHVTPDHIMSNWTDELLALMTEKLVERKQRESDAIKGRKPVSDSILSTIPGVKVIKRGN